MPDDYVPSADAPVGGNPVLLSGNTFARHAKAVESVEGENRALYPRSPRGRTTHPARGAWGFLASGATISGVSGLTLGSGTVQLCSRDGGGSFRLDGPDVEVLNSGGAINGPRILELNWTDGAFAVCVCDPGTFCGPPCTACGGIHLINGGTWSDAINSGVVSYIPPPLDRWQACVPGSGLLSTCGAAVWPSQIVVVQDDADGLCVTSTVPMPYFYVFKCESDGTVTLTLWMAWIECIYRDPFLITWDNAWAHAGDNAPLGMASSTVEPTCSGGVLTATFTLPATVAIGDSTLSTPSTSVSVTLPIEVAGDQTCCSMCAIPNEDLTLSELVGGVPTSTSTLIYSSSGPSWSDGTSTLSCNAGTLQLVDSRGAHADLLDDSTCEPFHLDFEYTSGGQTYNIYIDR